MTTVVEELSASSAPVMPEEQILAYRLVAEQVPLAGRGTPVSPPTYIGEKKGESVFARSAGVPIPEGQDRSRLGEPLVDEATGGLRTGEAVVIDSIGARSHALGQALQESLGRLLRQDLPGVYVGEPTEEDLIAGIASTWSSWRTKLTGVGVTEERFADEVRWAVEQTYVDDRISNWTVSHRHVDATIRYANDPDTGEQIWSGGAIGDLLRSMSAGTGDELIANAPSSAILGFWLSARSPRLHKLARSLVAEVVGYGVSGVYRGATKSDAQGGITSTQAALSVKKGTVLLEHKAPTDKDKNKPSNYGFGQIPNKPEEVAVTCEAILLRSTLSAQALRSQLRASEEHLALVEALGVLALLSQTELGFRRSGADFVTGAQRLTLVIAGGREVDVEAEQVLRAAEATVLAHAGLLAEPIRARASKLQVELVAGRVADGLLNGQEKKETAS